MDHAGLINALGGGRELSRRLKEHGHKVGEEAIYKWREFNRVPYKWRPVIATLARRRRIELPKNFLPSLSPGR